MSSASPLSCRAACGEIQKAGPTAQLLGRGAHGCPVSRSGACRPGTVEYDGEDKDKDKDKDKNKDKDKDLHLREDGSIEGKSRLPTANFILVNLIQGGLE